MEQDRQRMSEKLSIGKEIWYMTGEEVRSLVITDAEVAEDR